MVDLEAPGILPRWQNAFEILLIVLEAEPVGFGIYCKRLAEFALKHTWGIMLPRNCVPGVFPPAVHPLPTGSKMGIFDRCCLPAR